MDEERRQHEDRGTVHEKIEGLISKELKMEDDLGVKLHLRPGLQEYLRELTEVADVFAFTAGMSVYARPVIKYLDPEQKIFQKVWYRESCTRTQVGRNDLYTKDLESMKQHYDPNRTILVDNNIFSFLPQPSNGILVPDFYDNPEDNVLPQVLKVVKELQTESDVKPALHDMFNLTGHVEKTVNGMRFR
jgi:Dullard-like phosphatase family protein